jgi:hypothetical protein
MAEVRIRPVAELDTEGMCCIGERIAGKRSMCFGIGRSIGTSGYVRKGFNIRLRGRRLFLIGQLMDEATVERPPDHPSGTTIRMVRNMAIVKS